MTTIWQAAKAGNLTAMLEDYNDSVLTKGRGVTDDGSRLCSLMDFNAGQLSAIAVFAERLAKGESPTALCARLQIEAESIHERLNPELYRKNP